MKFQKVRDTGCNTKGSVFLSQYIGFCVACEMIFLFWYVQRFFQHPCINQCSVWWSKFISRIRGMSELFLHYKKQHQFVFSGSNCWYWKAMPKQSCLKPRSLKWPNQIRVDNEFPWIFWGFSLDSSPITAESPLCAFSLVSTSSVFSMAFDFWP